MEERISVYELIRNLPLFKGTGRDHISRFVEKVPVRLETLEKDEKILSPDEDCEGLIFLLRGAVKIKNYVKFEDRAGHHRESLLIEEVRNEGSILGLDRMFGLYRQEGREIRAFEQCTIMKINKSELLNLVKGDNIYLFNVLNYLSLRNQRCYMAVRRYRPGKLRELLACYVDILTERNYRLIKISSNMRFWRLLTGKTYVRLKKEFHEMIEEGLLEETHDGYILTSREQFLKTLND